MSVDVHHLYLLGVLGDIIMEQPPWTDARLLSTQFGICNIRLYLSIYNIRRQPLLSPPPRVAAAAPPVSDQQPQDKNASSLLLDKGRERSPSHPLTVSIYVTIQPLLHTSAPSPSPWTIQHNDLSATILVLWYQLIRLYIRFLLKHDGWIAIFWRFTRTRLCDWLLWSISLNDNGNSKDDKPSTKWTMYTYMESKEDSIPSHMVGLHNDTWYCIGRFVVSGSRWTWLGM